MIHGWLAAEVGSRDRGLGPSISRRPDSERHGGHRPITPVATRCHRRVPAVSPISGFSAEPGLE